MVRTVDPTGVAGTSANGQWRSYGNLGAPAASSLRAARSRFLLRLSFVYEKIAVRNGKKHRTQTRYRQAKETKCGEKNCRESECLDIP